MLEFRPHTDSGGSSDRSFGLVFAAFFALIAIWPVFSAHAPRLWAVLVVAAFLWLALVRPATLAPLNRCWTKLGLLLGAIVSPLAMGIVFYLTIFPIGLLLRLCGQDPLRLKKDPNAASYWTLRQPHGPDPKGMKNQF